MEPHLSKTELTNENKMVALQLLIAERIISKTASLSSHSLCRLEKSFQICDHIRQDSPFPKQYVTLRETPLCEP